MNSPGIKLTQDLILRPNVIEGHFGKYKVRALTPMRQNGRATPLADEKPSHKTLMLVLLAHILVFLALIISTPVEPKINASLKPMLVSLVSSPAPEPEVVPLLPTPPKPEPVVKKQQPKPKPEVQKPAPEPELVVAEQPPAAITPQPVAEAPTVKELPIIEPKIEPPRFGAAYLENPSPAYPAQSRRLGEEGKVLLRVLVSLDGNAEAVQIETGSGFGRLDQAALAAVKKWRFIPAKRNDQPISAYVIVPIKFSLES